MRIDAATHHTYLWPRVAVVDESGGFKIVRQTNVPEAPAPYLVEHDDPVKFLRAKAGRD